MFKPLLDTYLSPYKDRVFYWVGLQLLVRRIMFALTMLDKYTSLTIGSIVIGLVLCIQSILQPFKNKFKNVQESLVLFNLLTINILALHNKSPNEMLMIKILIFFATICLFTLIAVHCVMSTCGKAIRKQMNSLKTHFKVWQKQFSFLRKTSATEMIDMDSLRSRIADVTYNYQEFQEPLVELDD